VGSGLRDGLGAAGTDLADRVLRLPEVRAFAHPGNPGSRRVLEKRGFELVRFVPEMERLLHRRGRTGAC
jgi:RimJ/RimL family protein N-acetyltransferase